MDIIAIQNLWDILEIDKKLLTKRVASYIGFKVYTTSSKEESRKLLLRIIETSKRNILKFSIDYNVDDVVWSLTLIYSLINSYYRDLRVLRENVGKELSIDDEKFYNLLFSYNVISICLMDSINLWIENLLIINNNKSKEFDATEKSQQEFLVDIYLYYLCSYSLSLITLSSDIGYNLIRINANNDLPVFPIRYQSVKFFRDQLIFGNHGDLSSIKIPDLEGTEIDKSFHRSFGLGILDFLCALAVLNEIEIDSPFPSNIIMYDDLFDMLYQSLQAQSKVQNFINNFSVRKENLHPQIDETDDLIWKKGVNRYRLEICPLILLNDNKVIISKSHVRQSLDNWYSYIVNGGCIYSNLENDFSKCLTKFTEDLSQKLVSKISQVLRNQYPNILISINVPYNDIFQKNQISFGDYDIIGISGNTIFIIESKYISNSFTASILLHLKLAYN
jgi:hypothetical protein